MNHFDKLLMDLAVYKSETEDADITKVITELSIQQNMLEVSRASAAKVLQQSILDFLRIRHTFPTFLRSLLANHNARRANMLILTRKSGEGSRLGGCQVVILR